MPEELRSIGWYLKEPDGKVRGPYRREAVRDWISEGTLSVDTLARHGSQSRFQAAGDQGDLTQGLERKPNSGSKLPSKRAEVIKMAEGSIPCVKHHKKKAVTVCSRCLTPVCPGCLYRLDAYYCKACHASLYNRRTLAGLVDYVAIPFFLVFLQGALAIAGGLSRATMVGVLALSVLLCAYNLFKDTVFGGQSLGKALVGLQCVDYETCKPCTPGESFVRNGLLGVAFVSSFLASAFMPAVIQAYMGLFYLFIGFWWIVDVSRPWYDPEQRRPFDRWAGTLVTSTEGLLAKARRNGQGRLDKMLAATGVTLTGDGSRE